MLRLFHSSACLRTVSKSALAKLRKKTGYTFSNCRKALELHENDLGKAEEWLQQQARALGWEKATKLEGRPTAQGLIGVAISQNTAVMVEVNCETDFVARNGKFKSLVELVTSTCLSYPIPQDTDLNKVTLNGDQLKSLKSNDGKSLADQAALVIGNVGENVSLRRAVCYRTTNNLSLAAFTHPAPTILSSMCLGKYGSLVAYAQDGEKCTVETVDQVGRQLCQHIIGMNPMKIGKLGEDEPAEVAEDETVMVNQEYLLDPAVTVGQLLQDVGITVVDFTRFECGQQLEVLQQGEESQLGEEPQQKFRAEG